MLHGDIKLQGMFCVEAESKINYYIDIIMHYIEYLGILIDNSIKLSNNYEGKLAKIRPSRGGFAI